MNRFLHGLDVEVRRQRIRQAPDQYTPTNSGHLGKQIDETSFHRNVGNVRCKNLIEPRDFHVPHQVTLHQVRRMPADGVGLFVQRRYAHLLYQRGNVLAANPKAVLALHVTQHATAGIGTFHMQRTIASR